MLWKRLQKRAEGRYQPKRGTKMCTLLTVMAGVEEVFAQVAAKHPLAEDAPLL